MISEQLKQRLENATRTVWEDYKQQHLGLATAMEAELGDSLVTRVVEVLATGEEYEQLVLRTDQESSIAAIVAAIAPEVMKIISGMALG